MKLLFGAILLINQMPVQASVDVIVNCTDRDRMSVTISNENGTLKGSIKRNGSEVIKETVKGFVEDDLSIVFRSNKKFSSSTYNWYLTMSGNMNSFEVFDGDLTHKLEPVLNLRFNGLQCNSKFSRRDLVSLLSR